jgi:hypothetical protein
VIRRARDVERRERQATRLARLGVARHAVTLDDRVQIRRGRRGVHGGRCGTLWRGGARRRCRRGTLREAAGRGQPQPHGDPAEEDQMSAFQTL